MFQVTSVLFLASKISVQITLAIQSLPVICQAVVKQKLAHCARAHVSSISPLVFPRLQCKHFCSNCSISKLCHHSSSQSFSSSWGKHIFILLLVLSLIHLCTFQKSGWMRLTFLIIPAWFLSMILVMRRLEPNEYLPWQTY